MTRLCGVTVYILFNNTKDNVAIVQAQKWVSIKKILTWHFYNSNKNAPAVHRLSELLLFIL